MRGRLAEVVLGCSGHYIDPNVVCNPCTNASNPGSVFVPGQPSSNHVNRPQYPIRARLSIALQITSSVGWLSSSITHNNRGGGMF